MKSLCRSSWINTYFKETDSNTLFWQEWIKASQLWQLRSLWHPSFFLKCNQRLSVFCQRSSRRFITEGVRDSSDKRYLYHLGQVVAQEEISHCTKVGPTGCWFVTAAPHNVQNITSVCSKTWRVTCTMMKRSVYNGLGCLENTLQATEASAGWPCVIISGAKLKRFRKEELLFSWQTFFSPLHF